MNILVKYPSRERPHRFLDVLKGWVEKADDLNRIQFLFSFDTDDAKMREASKWIEKLNINAVTVYGTSRSKVDAINRDFDKADPWDAVLVVSDDMWCVHQGWDSEIRRACKMHPDHLVWFPDQKQRVMCTLPCMDKAYYDRDGWIYDPRFKSVFCDDLQTDIANQRERLVMVPLTIAEHRHPANVNNVLPDALYRRNETSEIWKHDEALYRALTPYPRK